MGRDRAQSLSFASITRPKTRQISMVKVFHYALAHGESEIECGVSANGIELCDDPTYQRFVVRFRSEPAGMMLTAYIQVLPSHVPSCRAPDRNFAHLECRSVSEPWQAGNISLWTSGGAEYGAAHLPRQGRT
jgi:hypothetical protein